MSLRASLDELKPEVFNFFRPIFGLSYRNFVYLMSGWKRHGKNHSLFESSNRFGVIQVHKNLNLGELLVTLRQKLR